MGWTWTPWQNCDNVLIKDWVGTPTANYGQYFHDHLVSLPARGLATLAAAPPTPSSTTTAPAGPASLTPARSPAPSPVPSPPQSPAPLTATSKSARAPASASPKPGPGPGGLAIRVSGNHLVDGSGNTVQLRGVDLSGTEFSCIQGGTASSRGWSIYGGQPLDQPSTYADIASWHANVVRVPLNEDCWLGINGAPAAFSGAAYRDAIVAYVGRLHDAGLYAIVDLHWSAHGTLPADGTTGQGRKMADRDHAPALWRSVGTTFRRDPAVVFDLFNEPHDISWDCWQNGCTTQDATGTWQVAGYQSLVDAVRASGAPNPVLVAGNRWAGDLRGWPHGVHDPMHQLAASWQVYSPGPRLDSLRDLVVRPVAAAYPV